MHRRINRTIAAAILITIAAGVIAFAATTSEPTATSPATSTTTQPEATGTEDTTPDTTDTTPESETAAAQPEAAETVAADDRSIYVDQCASCHGTNGEGGSGGPVDDLTLTLAEVVDITADGVPRMPAYRDVLTPEEIEAVSAYTLSLSTN